MRFLIAFLMLTTLFSLTACGDGKDKPKQKPPEVDVSLPVKHKITEWDEYTGRFEAVERVDVRARVTGYLVEKKFKDGQLVKKDDVLLVIDPRPFEYELQRVRAQYNLALKERNRAQKLRKTQAISQEDLDRRVQEFKVAEASLKDAKLDVEFTKVRAPIDGKVSDAFVDVGNLIRENETLLTRLVLVNPIHFEFEASQAQLLKYIRLDREGKRPGSDTNANPIFIKLQDEDNFVHLGRMDFVDNIVDPATGTIKGRAIVQNNDAVIYPGSFGRARLIGSGEYEAILLPEKAIQTDQNKRFVYVVNKENKVGRAYVKLGPVLDNGLLIIRDGLKGDEKVVVNGIQRIRAKDQPVTPAETPLKWIAIEDMPDIDNVPTIKQIIAKEGKKTEPKKEPAKAEDEKPEAKDVKTEKQKKQAP